MMFYIDEDDQISISVIRPHTPTSGCFHILFQMVVCDWWNVSEEAVITDEDKTIVDSEAFSRFPFKSLKVIKLNRIRSSVSHLKYNIPMSTTLDDRSGCHLIKKPCHIVPNSIRYRHSKALGFRQRLVE